MGFRSTENRRLQARHEAGAAVAPLLRGLVDAMNALLNTRAPALVQNGFFSGSTIARVPGTAREFRLTDPAGRTIAEGEWTAVLDDSERIVRHEQRKDTPGQRSGRR